ncbi:MAG: hypothetical protein QXF82_05430, partial [Nitrososphaeria archaeon]
MKSNDTNNQVKEKSVFLLRFFRPIRLLIIFLFILSFLSALTGIYFFTKKYCEGFFCLFSNPILILASVLLSSNLLVLMIHGLRVFADDTISRSFSTTRGKFPKTILVVTGIYLVVLIYEILSKGYTLLSPIFLFISLTLMIVSVKGCSILKRYFPQYLFVLIAVLIAVHYIRYTPSFGNDTWRDSIWTMETIYKGDYRLSNVRPEAYRIPTVVLFYSILSLILNLDPLLVSSLTGLIYLLIISLLINILVINKYTSSKEVGSFALLAIYATPLISLWTVEFIPQALSLIYVILFFAFVHIRKNSYFLSLEMVLFTLLIVMTIITHPGMGLLLLIYITILALREVTLRKTLITGVIAYLSYTVYAIFTVMLRSGYLYIKNLLSIFLGESETHLIAYGTSKGILYTISPWLGPIVIVILTINVILHDIIEVLGPFSRKTDKEKAKHDLLITFLSLSFIGIAYIMIILDPFSTADRYLGLLSFTLLALFIPRGLKILENSGYSGRIFTYVLLTLLVVQIAFGGTFTPNNPLTINTNTYSIYGLISYSEREQIEHLSNLIQWGRINLLTDWRTGLFLNYIISTSNRNEFSPSYGGFEYLGTQIIFAGS